MTIKSRENTYSKNCVDERIVATVAHSKPMTSKKDQSNMLKTATQEYETNTFLHKGNAFTYQQNWEEITWRNKIHDKVTNKWQKPPPQKSSI